MKVLHVYRTYYPDPPGGLQQAIRQIAAGCQTLGVESRIFTLSPQPQPPVIDRPEGAVHRARSYAAPASCDLGGPEAFWRYARNVRWADIVHLHYPWPFADLLDLLSPQGKPRVMTYHSDIVKQKVLGKLYHPLMRWTLSRMDAVVATSPRYAQTSPVLTRFVRPERLHAIPLCMADATAEPELAADTDILQRLSLQGRPYVMSLGVLRYYKGLHVLVEAARQIQGAVVLAGNGPEEAALRAQVAALGLDNVHFAGLVNESDKHTLLRHCTALALPSHLRSEAYGMVLLEAAMHGKPQVSCEIGSGTSWVNQDGVSGFVVPPEDPAALATALNRLLTQPALAHTLGAQARERYLRDFTPAAMAQAYRGLYETVAAG